MSLLNQNVQNTGQIKSFFDRIREAQAPSKFTIQFLNDIGFTSSNFRAFLPLLKGLGFLSEDGTPKSEYMRLLDSTQWKVAVGDALKRSYSDIFMMKAKPSRADKDAIIGKFKSTYNLSEIVAERSANTFLGLLELAEFSSTPASQAPPKEEPNVQDQVPPPPLKGAGLPPTAPQNAPGALSLAYNIQIHLPATKDLEVDNAIFRSLREHLVR